MKGAAHSDGLQAAVEFRQLKTAACCWPEQLLPALSHPRPPPPLIPCPSQAGKMCGSDGGQPKCVDSNCKNVYLYRCGGSSSVKLDTSCSSKGVDCAKAPDGSFACSLSQGAASYSC